MYSKYILFYLFLFLACFEQNSVVAQQWKSLGPDSVPKPISAKNHSLNFASGIGRVANLRTFSKKLKKGEESVLFLGTPYGGLWRLNPGDKKWTRENTDQLLHIGVSDFAMNPKQTDIRYIITGDPDCILDPNGPTLGSEFCQSRGIVKSIDSGKSWSDTAIGKWYNQKGELEKDFWKFPSRKVARRILMDPKCSDRLTTIIHTYTSSTKTFDGFVYQSEDAGASWNVRLAALDAFIKDIEYKPGSGKVMYASGRSVYKSQDAGKTWIQLNNHGLPPDTLVKRIEVACSPSSPSTLYALVIYKNARNSDIYISADDAKSFQKIVSAQSSPEWRTAMVVDPVNSSLVYFSAGNRVHRLYQNSNGWRQEYTGGFIHDDVHELTYPSEGRKLYASTDGGIHSSVDSGKTWLDLSAGLNIAECWSVAVSQTGPISVISGLQDCGSILYRSFPDSADGWWIVRGGDGMATAIDYQDEYILYSNDGNNNLISRSFDGGVSWSGNLLPTRNETAIYQRPFVIDPSRKGVIYTGLQNVYKSTDFGDSWIRYSDFNFLSKNDKLVALALTPQDSNVFYAAFVNPVWSKDVEKKIFKTTDGGKNWLDVSKGLTGVAWTTITSLVIDPENMNTVYVGFRGGWVYKIMRSTDGGATWENYSTGLGDDADVNALIVDKNVFHTVYAATHTGVYKRSNEDGAWIRLGSGLPRVVVSALDIRFDSKTLYAGTHGLGIWYIGLEE